MKAAGSLPLRQLTYAVIDVETTGLSSRLGDRICEVAVVLGHNGAIVDQMQTLVNPGRPISYGASAVNGITDNMVRNAPPFRKVAQLLSDFLDSENTVIVAHNSSFDLGFISAEMRQAGFTPPSNSVVDTLALARKFYTFPSNKLGIVAKSLGIKTFGLHRALADATITWHVLKRFLWDLEAAGITTLDELTRVQGSLTPASGWRGGMAATAPPIAEWDGTQPFCPIQGLPPLVEQAMRTRTAVKIRYAGSDGRISVRVVQPIKVTLHEQATYLIGYCHLRKEERQFRLDRIVELRIEGLVS